MVGGGAWRGSGAERGGGLGVGEVRVRVLPAAALGYPIFVRFLALSFFLPFLSYTIQARTRISVYICPILHKCPWFA